MSLYPGFPLAQSDYIIGTISLVANSKDFTLSGANPVDFAAATAGDEIYIPQAGKVLLIETITNSGGTLVYNCPADCAGASQPFHLRLKPSASRLQGMVTTLLQKLGSGNLAGLDELTIQDDQLIAGDGIQGKFKAVNIADLQTVLPEILTAIASLSLNKDQVIAGGTQAGEVKAINLPDISGKLDKAGGTMTGNLSLESGVTVNGGQYPFYNVAIPNGADAGGGLALVPQAGGKRAEVAYLAGGGVRIWIEGSGNVASFAPDGQAWFTSNVHVGNAALGTDGNIWGTTWEPYGQSGLHGAIHAIADQKINARCVTNTRFEGWVDSGNITPDSAWVAPSGYVVAGGYKGGNSELVALYARQPQVEIPNIGWRAFGSW